MQETWVDPWVKDIPWKRKWQPTPVFLPGKSHGQKSLAGYSPQGHKPLDMTQQLNTTTSIYKVDNQHGPIDSTGNQIQYFVITYKGKEFEKECIYN